MASIGGCAVRRTLAFLLLVLAGSTLAGAQSKVVTTQEIETVDFCNLIRHPDQYDGKTVKVRAMYDGSLEGASFSDDNCKKSGAESEAEVTANARFTGGSTETAQAFKKLSKFLDKHRTDQAKVTMIAVFRDEFFPNRITGGAFFSRYTLQVKQLLAVEPVKPSAARISKD
jgi:hypothetical protein